MDPATQARIFEPFFTTKFAGRGLGLSAVLGIVGSYQGALSVESQVGTGTRFRILLPVTGKGIEIPTPRAAYRAILCTAAAPSWWWTMNRWCSPSRAARWSDPVIRC